MSTGGSPRLLHAHRHLFLLPKPTSTCPHPGPLPDEPSADLYPWLPLCYEVLAIRACSSAGSPCFPKGRRRGFCCRLAEQLRDLWPVCFTFQVKINSRGLVYSVVLLLGSVALTVSFYLVTHTFTQFSLAVRASLSLAHCGEGHSQGHVSIQRYPKSISFCQDQLQPL